MKPSLISITILCATAFSSSALAHEQKSMLGTWTTRAQVAIIGNAALHHETGDEVGVRFIETDFILEIDKVKGRNFSGHLSSTDHREVVAGAFMPDSINGVMVDSDGSSVLKRVGDDLIEVCYVHLPTPNNESSVATCLELKRQ